MERKREFRQEDQVEYHLKKLAVEMVLPWEKMQEFKDKDFVTFITTVKGVGREILAGATADAVIQQAKFGPEKSKTTGEQIKFPGYLPLAEIELMVQAIFDELTHPNNNWTSE